MRENKCFQEISYRSHMTWSSSSSFSIFSFVDFGFKLWSFFMDNPRTTGTGQKSQSQNFKTLFFSRYQKFLLMCYWHWSKFSPVFSFQKWSLEPFKLSTNNAEEGWLIEFWAKAKIFLSIWHIHMKHLDLPSYRLYFNWNYFWLSKEVFTSLLPQV